MKPMNEEKGLNKIKNINVPITLNITCEAANLFADVFEPITAIIAVIVVPILSPNKTGNAPFKSINPSW